MSWSDVSKVIGKYAPLAGSLLGGPAGGAVGALVASALGVENTAEAVTAAMATDPEAMIKLKAMELKHKERFEEIALERTRVELADKADARENHKHSIMPAVICIGLTLLVAAGGYMLLTMAIPAGNKEITYMLFGQVTALWGASVTYWVGTTRSSAEKSRGLR